MSDPAPNQDGSLMGTLASWGGSAWAAASAAASSVSSFLGFEDLDVVDPTAGGAAKSTADANDQRQQAFANFREYIGADITSLVTLPVWIMEPYTLLQKVAEIMEYTHLLDTAADTDDELERLAWVAGFCLGPFGGNERTWKPFNPILGETFELDLPCGGRFLAEQVSHHPPIAAAHAASAKWAYDIVSAPTTKFLGNAVDIYPVGRSRIALPARGEVYSLVPPNSKAHNLIVGRTWVDCYGDFSLINTATGARCSLYFTPCGWFGAGRYQVAGHIMDGSGVKRLAVSGAWNSHLDVTRCDADGTAVPGAGTTRVWRCAPKPEGDKYGFTHFARKLCDGAGIAPLPSDSRRRPDRAALAAGDHGKAGAAKHALEEAQRAEKKERTARGDGWAPRWFKAAAEGAALYPGEYSRKECPMWEFGGEWPPPAAAADAGADCNGVGFKPWQYEATKTALE